MTKAFYKVLMSKECFSVLLSLLISFRWWSPVCSKLKKKIISQLLLLILFQSLGSIAKLSAVQSMLLNILAVWTSGIDFNILYLSCLVFKIAILPHGYVATVNYIISHLLTSVMFGILSNLLFLCVSLSPLELSSSTLVQLLLLQVTPSHD